MRNLFFALVLANLAFGAWSAWHSTAPSATVAAGGGNGSIRLVSEVGESSMGTEAEARNAAEPAQERAADDAPASSAASASGAEASLDAASSSPPGTGSAPSSASVRRCVSVGPFADLSDAAAASSRLRAAGRDASQRVAEGDIWVGYWVHIDAIRTRDEANRIVSELHANGVDEAYLIPGEEDGDIVSLGVFSEAARAGRLRQQVRDLGYDPVVVDRSRRGTVYWVDVELPPGGDLDLETLQAPGRITRLEQRPCPAPAG